MTLKKINSLTNQHIKNLKKLIKSSKERQKHKLFTVEGSRGVITFLESRFILHSLFITEKFIDFVFNNNLSEQAFLVSDNIIDQISLQVSSSGMIAIFAIPEQSKDFDTNSVILAQVSDPGNLGTIVRTCAAFGILNIICINCCDVWSPKVVQSAVGNLSKVNIINLSWQEMINYKLKNNLKICGLVVDSQNSIKNIKNNSYILVIGNEANGIPQEWQKDCDILATIKMQNNVESLNASIAAAIAIYEIKNF